MELNRLTGTFTIAAAYGSGGRVIGPAVAERLGLPFVDRAIPSYHSLALTESPTQGFETVRL
jgi:hypothetical protein